jgi:hypothetical protein
MRCNGIRAGWNTSLQATSPGGLVALLPAMFCR